MSRDEDRWSPKPPCEVEATLLSQPDIDEYDVRPQLLLESLGVGARRRNADDRHALSLEQQARGVEEGWAVIDDEAADSRILARQVHGNIPTVREPLLAGSRQRTGSRPFRPYAPAAA